MNHMNDPSYVLQMIQMYPFLLQHAPATLSDC